MLDSEHIRVDKKAKKTKKRKRTREKNKRKHEAVDEQIQNKQQRRSYTCNWCSSTSPFTTIDPVQFSNHVRSCKHANTTTVISNCLKGTIVSVSLWSKPNSSRSFDEKEVKNILVSLGATYSPTVHRKVNILVATNDAVERGTQRVRKATKKNIPIVLPEWLEACVANKREVQIDDYTLSFEKRSSSGGGSSESKPNNEEVDATKDLQSSTLMKHVQRFDLGCCCGCHDIVPPLSTCEWCPQCYT
jgi:hypothetical protein